jgi:hypothetical protein
LHQKEQTVRIRTGGVSVALLALDFFKAIIPALLQRFAFVYYQENTCIEYFITKTGTQEPISQAIVFSLNRPSDQINVSRFYPELHKQIHCKYLSAACFYLLAHHFASIYQLPKGYRICLETQPDTFATFYSKLQDFHFQLQWVELCKTGHVCGKYPDLLIDTTKVKQKILQSSDIPFLVH